MRCASALRSAGSCARGWLRVRKPCRGTARTTAAATISVSTVHRSASFTNTQPPREPDKNPA
jgi:hypothetical protein